MACRSCKDLYDFVAEAQHQIELFSLSTTITSTGGENATWVSAGTFWAAIKPSTGREIYEFGTLTSRISHVVTIRYQAALKNTTNAAKYKFTFDDRTFSVNYIKNLDETLTLEGNVFQKLYVEENANEFV